MLQAERLALILHALTTSRRYTARQRSGLGESGNLTWWILYRIDPDAIVILEVFEKKTEQTLKRVLDVCKKRLSEYDTI